MVAFIKQIRLAHTLWLTASRDMARIAPKVASITPHCCMQNRIQFVACQSGNKRRGPPWQAPWRLLSLVEYGFNIVDEIDYYWRTSADYPWQAEK